MTGTFTLSAILTEPMIAEMTATRGVIIIGIGIKLLDIKQLPLANFVPAIFAAPAILAPMPCREGACAGGCTSCEVSVQLTWMNKNALY